MINNFQPRPHARYQIRKGTEDDLIRLATMGLRFIATGAFPMLACATERSLVTIMLGVLQAGEQGCMLVAIDPFDLRLVGGVIGCVLPMPLTQKLYVDELGWWVEPEARHARVGPMLLAELESWAFGRGLGIMMRAPHGTKIGKFYEHRGYKPIETAWWKES